MPAKTTHAPTPEEQPTLASLLSRLEVVEKRLTLVEMAAHSEHALESEAVSRIADMAVEQVKTDVLAQLGMSGFPARGDA